LRFLLDTNAFLRHTGDLPVPRAARRLLSRRDATPVVSIVSCWEIVLKPKLGLAVSDVDAAVREMGAELLPVRLTHLERLSHLPFHDDHRDPFDRLLIAQALAEETPLLTSDARFSAYKHLRVVWD